MDVDLDNVGFSIETVAACVADHLVETGEIDLSGNVTPELGQALARNLLERMMPAIGRAVAARAEELAEIEEMARTDSWPRPRPTFPR